MKFTADQLAEVYIRMRDKKNELKKAYEEEVRTIDSQMETLERYMLDLCEKSGADSLRTENGTITRSVRSRYWATDWEALHKYILENQALHLLERRVAQGAAKEWVAENEDKLPPGVAVDNRYVVTVRRPTNK